MIYNIPSAKGYYFISSKLLYLPLQLDLLKAVMKNSLISVEYASVEAFKKYVR